MRIGIDARFYGSLGKGLGRYTEKLIKNLQEIDKKNQYFIFLLKENFQECEIVSQNFHKIIVNCRWYTLKEQISLPLILNQYRLDLVHFPHFNVPLLYRKNFIVTIHDLILISFPTLRRTTLNPLFYRLKFLAYRFVINSAIKRAKKIITVSRFTKKDLLRNYSLSAEKIAITYEACEPRLKSKSDKNRSVQVLEKYGIIKPYLLYVGNAYPHKNLEKLILAFQLLRKRVGNLNLVLIGKEDYFFKKLKEKTKKQKTNEKIIFTGFVPDFELEEIYRHAQIYVFPSLYEGFGLPPLEAMAQGVPVASSNHPCMKEILENSVLYFDAQKKEDMAEKLHLLLQDENLKKTLIARGLEQIKKYSWKVMAEKTLSLYQKYGFQKK